MPNPNPDVSLVTVFTTDEMGLLPLAKLALEQEQIEYFVREAPKSPMAAGGKSFRGDTQMVPIEIQVGSDQAARARELLADLEASAGAALMSGPAPEMTPASPPSAPLTVSLFDRESGALVGRISDGQLDWLTDQLEEESDDDTDYYIDRPTIDMLKEAGADAALLEILRNALGGRDGVEIRWSRNS